jgi:hypothetical protein
VKATGIVLVLVGVAIIVWGAFGFKTRETILDAGPIHATEDKEHHVPYGPVAGGLLAIGGVVLLMKASR